jgi:hypothetical protein
MPERERVLAARLSRKKTTAMSIAAWMLWRMASLLRVTPLLGMCARRRAPVRAAAKHTSAQSGGSSEGAPSPSDNAALTAELRHFSEQLLLRYDDRLGSPYDRRENRVLETFQSCIGSVGGPSPHTRSELTRDGFLILQAVAERHASLLGTLAKDGTAQGRSLRLDSRGVRAVAFCYAWLLREQRDMLKALETWPPEKLPARRAYQLESFVTHMLSFPRPPTSRLPPFIYQNIVADSPLTRGLDSERARRFVAAVTSVLSGASSPREAFRTSFEHLVLTPAATHALLEMSAANAKVDWKEDPVTLLRAAQVAAMMPPGKRFSQSFIALLAKHLMPPMLCATAAEEDYWLRSARFVVKRLPEVDETHATEADADTPDVFSLKSTLRDAQADIKRAAKLYTNWPALCDLAFWLHCKFQSAIADDRAPPPGFAPWAGMTLRTLCCRAEANRAAAPFSVRRSWRLPLYARNGRFSDTWEGELRRGRFDENPVPGTWRAVELSSIAAIRKEGEAQRNCLRSLGGISSRRFYWSLRFMPRDAAAAEAAGADALKGDRVTVQLVCRGDVDAVPMLCAVEQRKLKRNKDIDLEVWRDLLAQWKRASGIHLSDSSP